MTMHPTTRSTTPMTTHPTTPMTTHRSAGNGALRLALGLGLIVGTACTPEGPSVLMGLASADLTDTSLPVPDGRIDLCHKPGDGGGIIRVSVNALAAHLAHGDYRATLTVTHDAALPEGGAHFATISSAIAAARASRLAAGETLTASCRITILVEAGTWEGTAGAATGEQEQFPLVVDVPDLTLRGATYMGIDDDGIAMGIPESDVETVLSPVAPLPFVGGLSTPLIVVNAHPDGSAGHGLTVRGFVFKSGHVAGVSAGGQGILALRATGLTIRGNRFEGGFTESIDLRASSAELLENHLSGTAGTCDLCLAGPGTFRVEGNRLLAGGIPGISVSPTVSLPLPAGVEPYVLPAAAEVWAEIRNNEVSDHQRVPVGVGIRMDAVGVGAPNVNGTIHAVVRDNVLTENRFGVIVHAAFPTATTARKGNVKLTLGGNEFAGRGSCQANLLVSFARHTTGLGITNTPYLLGSTFELTLNGDVAWDQAWYSHPAAFGNRLVVDGTEIGNGARQSYVAAGCPGWS